MKQLLPVVFALVVPLSAFAAEPAPKIDWKACAKEIKEFNCKGNDKAKWACLEKHDAQLSEACDKEHAKGDKAFE